jgi:hypothetical protein
MWYVTLFYFFNCVGNDSIDVLQFSMIHFHTLLSVVGFWDFHTNLYFVHP